MGSLKLKNAISSKSKGLSLLEAGKSFNFITQSMRIKFLESFEKDLDGNTNPLYCFYGQSLKWDSPNSSDSPPKPNNAFKFNINARRNMIACRRINASDTKMAFKRRTWSSGTVYNQYDTEVDQSVSPNDNFYVVQDNPGQINYGAVYKCLDNNGGAPSIVKPFQAITTPSINAETLADGYKWKYMFTIGGADISKFNTDQSPSDNFLPMNPDTTYAAPRGTIDRIDINSPGIGYKPVANSLGKYLGVYDTPVVPIFVEGDGNEIDTAELIIETVNESNDNSIATFDVTRGVNNGTRTAKYIYSEADSKLNNWVPVKFVEEFTIDTDTSITQVARKFAYGIAKINSSTGYIDSPGDIIVINGGSKYSIGSRVRVVQSSTLAYGIEYDSPNEGLSKVKVIYPGARHAQASIIPIHASPGPVGFEGKAVISPLRGHGGDPRVELNANAIFINTRVTSVDTDGSVNSNVDFPAVNDFRQVGLIQGANKFGLQEKAIDTTLSAMYTLDITDNTEGEVHTLQTSLSASYQDLKIVGSKTRAEGRIVDIFGSTNKKKIRYNLVGTKTFVAGENLLFDNVTSEVKIDEVYQPEIDVYTGDILYINNNNSITRSKNQTETINFLITF